MKSWIIGVSSNYLWWSTPEEQNLFYFLGDNHLEIEKINFLWKGLYFEYHSVVCYCFTVIEFHIPFIYLCLPFPRGRKLVKNNQFATVTKIRKNGSRRTELSVIFHISCAGIETNVMISKLSLRTFTQGHPQNLYRGDVDCCRSWVDHPRVLVECAVVWKTRQMLRVRIFKTLTCFGIWNRRVKCALNVTYFKLNRGNFNTPTVLATVCSNPLVAPLLETTQYLT